MTSWDALAEELDRWAESGRRATLWWRDDDAVEPTAAFERLLGIAAGEGVPVGVAVIPEGAGEALARRLDGTAGVRVMQHGWAHRNHAPAGAKKCELDGSRSRDEVVAELAAGRARLAALFGPVRVLVPPWNRVRDDVLEALPGIGLDGLSTFGPRRARRPAPGLSQTNTHVDIIDWRARRAFAGTPAILGALIGHLAARRAGSVDSAEATGVLSHHGVHDERCWSFLPELLRQTRAHPGALWVDPDGAVLG